MTTPAPRTDDPAYAERLQRLSGAWWKRVLDVQRPYRWRLRRHDLGRTLEVGCGIGRLLALLPAGSVGVDHNADSVAVARARGLAAFTPAELAEAPEAAGPFDSLLLAHVLEHMPHEDGVALLREYLPRVRPGGTVLFICPQERGFASDATHVLFHDEALLVATAREVGLLPGRVESFPLPRAAGRFFTHNELHLRSRVPDA